MTTKKTTAAITLRDLCNAYPGKVQALARVTGVGERSFYRMLRGEAVRSLVTVLEQLAALFQEQGGYLDERGGTVDKLHALWAERRGG